MKLSNLKVGVRLGLAFSTVLVLATLVGVFAISRLAVVNEATKDVATNWLLATRLLGDYRSAMNQMRLAESQHMMSEGLEEYTAWEKRIEEMRDRAALTWAKYEATVELPQEKALMDEVSAAQRHYYAVQPALLKMSRETDGVNDELRKIYAGESSQAFNALLAALIRDIDYQGQQSDAVYAQSQEVFSSTRALVIGLLLGAIAISLVLAWSITRSLTRPITQALQVARTVASGDLTSSIEVTSKDEVGELLGALSDMNTRLAGVVSQVRNSSDSIATGSQQIAVGNADLSQRTEEQASNLQQTAASMEQLTATVQQNTESALQASQLATQASDIARQGGRVVGQVVDTMDAIAQSSSRISDIIGVIDGIAFQTNILALNAAVEAARAGEQGRGFAVVAGEVRTLAQRSAQAAKEIKDLISESVDKVQAGTTLVATAGQTMGEVVASVKRVSDLVEEISAASREQSAGIGQVGDAIQQLDQVTQQNAALVEESAAASDSLQAQARQLTGIVSFFRVVEGDRTLILPSAGGPSASSAALNSVRAKSMNSL